MFNLIIGIILICLGGWNIYCSNDISKYVLKTEVVKAVSGDWRTQIFSPNGQVLTDAQGNTHFYAAKDIDERIKKLNEVLSK